MSPLLIRALILIASWGLTLMTSSNPNYLPKAPLPNTTALGLGLQRSNLRDTEVQSTTAGNVVMKSVALLSPLTSGDTEAQGHATSFLPTGPRTREAPPWRPCSPFGFPERPGPMCPQQEPCPRPRGPSPSMRSDLGWRCLFVPAGDPWPARIIGF